MKHIYSIAVPDEEDRGMIHHTLYEPNGEEFGEILEDTYIGSYDISPEDGEIEAYSTLTEAAEALGLVYLGGVFDVQAQD